MPKDFIDTSERQGGLSLRNMTNFTIVIKAIVTGTHNYFVVLFSYPYSLKKHSGGKGLWRTLLAHSGCGGFALVINDNDEVVLEHTCHLHQLHSGFKPMIGGRLA